MDELRNDDMQDEELERYGVWVKAGPEEVVEADDDYSLSDLSEEPIDDVESTGETVDLPALDEFDDISLDDLDFGEDDANDSADSSELPSEGEPLTLGDPSDELIIDTPSAAEPEADAADELDEAEEEDLISLDDFDLDVPEEDPDPFEALPDEAEPDEGPAKESPEEPVEASADDFSLDELEEELPADFEELDLDASGSLEGDEFDSSIPGSDGELDDLSMDDFSVEDSTEELPELEVDSIDDSDHDFTPEDQGIEIDTVHPSNTLSPDEEEFLSDESDLQNESESAIPAAMDLQEREAFERIQTELTDIKKELAELKAALRGAGTSAAHEASPREELTPEAADFAAPIDDTQSKEVPQEASESDSVQPGPGFFEEEEDETIALTGDELDNILNTAEFTEQAGEAVELEDDFIVEPEPPTAEDDSIVEPESPTAEDDLDTELDLDDQVEFDTEDIGDEDIDDTEDTLDSIELEPTERDSVVFEGDDSAVDELAEMDIDSELADIDSLEDETEDASDDLEIDIDNLDEVDTSGVLEDSAEAAAEEGAAEMDQQSLQAETNDIDDLEIDDLDLDLEDEDEADEFDQFAAAVEEDISSGETGIDLDEQFDQEPTAEATPEAPELDIEDEAEIEIDLDDIDGIDEFEEEETLPEAPASDSEEADEEQPSHEQEHLAAQSAASISDLPDDLKQEIRSVLSYMDQLLEALPDDKIEEFAHSEHFEVYKRLFEELGLET